MAGYDVNVGKDLLPGLLSGQDGLAKLAGLNEAGNNCGSLRKGHNVWCNASRND